MQNLFSNYFAEFINGQFDPLTLSIVETAPNDEWRKYIQSDNSNTLDIYKNTDDWRIFADIVNKHEQDHFLVHIGSQLGLLYTFLLVIKHAALRNLILTQKAEPNNFELIKFRHNILHNLSEVIHVLFGTASNYSQGEAVKVINRLYSTYFGIDNFFVARYPDLPANPSEFHSYGNILEASAIAMEESIALGANLSEEHISDFMRFNQRDPSIYFNLLNHLKGKLKYISLCRLICKYALDAQVPQFFNESNSQIYWDDIHPGWRLYKLTEYATVLLEKEGWSNDDIGDLLNSSYQFIPQFIYVIWDMMERSQKAVFRQKTFYERAKEDLFVNKETLFKNVKDSFRPYFKDGIFGNFGYVLNHSIDSHNTLIRQCSTLPLNFYFIFRNTAMSSSKLDNVPKEYFDPQKSNPQEKGPFVLYSIQKGFYNSMFILDKPLDVIYAILLNAEQVIMKHKIDGYSKEQIFRILNNLARFEEATLNSSFKTLLSQRLDSLT